MTPALACAAVLPLVVSTGACGAKAARETDGSVAVTPSPGPAAAPASASSQADTPARTLQRPAPLPRLARELLDASMLEHGDHMENLLWASLMVDFETTRTLCEAMSRAPRIARPPAGEDLLNAVFPAKFFELQDELYLAIDALGAAASAKDDSHLASAYARLATTCVTCHSIYLQTGLPASPSGATAP